MKKISNEKLLKAIKTQEERLENSLEIQRIYPEWKELKEDEQKIREILTELYLEKSKRGL